MYYARYNKIEARFQRAVSLIWGFKANTETLVEQLKVSRPTLIRIINELRRRGFTINVVRDSTGWHYEATHLWGKQLPSLDNWIKTLSAAQAQTSSNITEYSQPDKHP